MTDKLRRQLIDTAIAMKPDIDRYLRQDVGESTDLSTSTAGLLQLAQRRHPVAHTFASHGLHQRCHHIVLLDQLVDIADLDPGAKGDSVAAAGVEERLDDGGRPKARDA